MEQFEVKSYDITACNMSWDCNKRPVRNEQHLLITPCNSISDTPSPDLIENLKDCG